MTAPIGPGDWVECVNASPFHSRNAVSNRLRVGAIYQIANCGLDPGDGVPIVWLVGLDSGDFTRAFLAARFRPIYRPKASLIESLLTAKPVRVGEDA